MSMKRMFSEGDLQKAQVSYLAGRRDTKRDLMFCAIPNDAAMFATNGKMNYAKMNSLKATGLVTGAPDLIVWMRGRVIQIENKTKGNRQSASQEWFEERLRALGHEYHLIAAETPGDAVNQLVTILDAT